MRASTVAAASSEIWQCLGRVMVADGGQAVEVKGKLKMVLMLSSIEAGREKERGVG